MPLTVESNIATTTIHTPIIVNATSLSGKWKIVPWDDATAEKVVDFLKNSSFEFYSTGTAPSEAVAQKLVYNARARAEAGIPFTRFAVTDIEGNVIGEFAIGFDDNPRKLQLAGRGIEQLHGQGIGKEILEWCFTQYIPTLHNKGYRLPVFENGQSHLPWEEKRVAEWVDLREVTVVATVHPDYEHGNNLLSKSGFTKVEEITKENFEGAHDGRRNVYEIALATFLK